MRRSHLVESSLAAGLFGRMYPASSGGAGAPVGYWSRIRQHRRAARTRVACRARPARALPSRWQRSIPRWPVQSISIANDPTVPPYETRDPANFDKLIGFDREMIDAVTEWDWCQQTTTTGRLVRPPAVGHRWPGARSRGPALYMAERATQVDYVVFMQAVLCVSCMRAIPRTSVLNGRGLGLRETAGPGTVEEGRIPRSESEMCRRQKNRRNNRSSPILTHPGAPDYSEPIAPFFYRLYSVIDCRRTTARFSGRSPS